MKLLLSILMLPSFAAVFFAGLAFAFYRYCSELPTASEFSSQAHFLKGFLYLAIVVGIPASVYCALSGILLGFLSFVFKSWRRAFLSLAISAAGMYIWHYLLTVPYPN